MGQEILHLLDDTAEALNFYHGMVDVQLMRSALAEGMVTNSQVETTNPKDKLGQNCLILE